MRSMSNNIKGRKLQDVLENWGGQSIERKSINKLKEYRKIVTKDNMNPFEKAFAMYEKIEKPAITYNQPAIYYISIENE